MTRIAEGLGTDELMNRLDRWLKLRTRDNGARVLSCTAPAGGISSETLLVETQQSGHADRSLVVRVQPSIHQQVYLDADVTAQCAAMRGVTGEVPVPEIVWEEGDLSVLGQPFFVMERVAGRIPSTMPTFHAGGWVAELDPRERHRMAMNAIDVLAAIGRVDTGGIDEQIVPAGHQSGLAGYLDWTGRWLDWSTDGAPPELLRDAMGELRGSIPAGQVDGLFWGDCRAGNMIFADDLSVAAVLDWEMAGIGPAEIDLGWWLMMERWTTEGFRVPALEGWPTRAELISRYETGLGRTAHDIDYYELLAATRYAIIGLRTTRLMIDAGALPSDSTMGTENPVTQLLCAMMGRPVPALSPDVEAVLAAMSE
jgi:aminoglycoside phosphotransferase (APT) family kinase protein